MKKKPAVGLYALLVLERRQRAGVRGIDCERSRFRVHIEGTELAAMSIDQARAVHLRAWLRDMDEKTVRGARGGRRISRSTIDRALALLSAIFTGAIQDELIETNPCNGVGLPPRADEEATKDKWTVLSLEEQLAIAACEEIPYEHRVAIRFAIDTGLRQMEQFCLQIADCHVDGDRPHVFVRFGSPGLPPKSRHSRRRVPLFGDGLVAAREALKIAAGYPNPHGLVFPSPWGAYRTKGKPLGGRRVEGGKYVDAWARAKKDAGIERRVRWHDLRHTFGSNLVSGVLGYSWPLERIQKVMGHASITQTERYAHLGDNAVEEAARETDEAVRRRDVKPAKPPKARATAQLELALAEPAPESAPTTAPPASLIRRLGGLVRPLVRATARRVAQALDDKETGTK